jgi:hypothetical protein
MDLGVLQACMRAWRTHAGTVKLSYEGTGSLSQAPGGFYIERTVSLGMEAFNIRTRELMIMRRLVPISAEVSGLGHLI